MVDIWDSLEKAVGRPLPPVARRALLGITVFGGTFLALAGPGIAAPAIAAATALIFGGSATGAALWLSRPPKAPKGTTGFIVALEAEDEDLAGQLRADFVRELHRVARGLHLRKPLHIVEYPRDLAAAVRDPHSAMAALRASRSELVLFGQVRTRQMGSKLQHVLDPRLFIRHSPIGTQQSAAISKDVDQVLPPRFFIDSQTGLLGFEFASGLISIAGQYTIALVAGATGELDYAEELLKDLRSRLGERLKDFPPLRHLSTAIPDHLADIYGVHAGKHFRAWGRTRDKSELVHNERYVDQMLELQPANHFALLGKAIAAFVLRRDVAVAQSCVNKCRSSTDATWRYSDAFLQLYRGRLDRARAAYRAAAKSPTNELSDYLQAEVFIQEVLDEEPDKVQLLFGLAAINLLIKGDLVAAERDAKRFREADPANRYGPYHVWLEDEITKARQREP